MNSKASNGPVVALHGVSKHFSQVEVLREVDLSLVAGEVVALVGDNGAGKSALVKIISGVHSADAGELMINGVPTRFKNPIEP